MLLGNDDTYLKISLSNRYNYCHKFSLVIKKDNYIKSEIYS